MSDIHTSDIEITDQILVELGKPASTSPGRKRKPPQLFIKGPIPVSWSTQVNVGANTVVVALIVTMLLDMSGIQPVSIGRALWQQLGLSRDARKRALNALERAALIRTERSPGRATKIWLLVEPRHTPPVNED
jgi:hypothetical protein